MIEVIDNHSVRTDLLSGLPVIDAGCRGFRFAEWFAERGHSVLALDPGPDIKAPVNMKIGFNRVALVSEKEPRLMTLERGGDPEAWYVHHDPRPENWACAVPTTHLGWVDGSWDVMKLNIEGSEYEVLSDLHRPIARQIVVSFHEHTARRRGDAAIQEIVDHLAQWYVPIQHVKDERYCAGPNYWDSLFVLKELA